MLFTSNYLSSETFTKPANNCGSFEYLIQYARRLLQQAGGSVEIRNADGTLAASLYAEGEEVVEWINPSFAKAA